MSLRHYAFLKGVGATITRNFFAVTAFLETGAGLALIAAPFAPSSALFAPGIETPVASVLSQVGGAAIVSLGVACWLARNDETSRTATGLIAAMLLYNTAVVAVLVYASLGLGLSGIGTWAGATLHTAMAIWCVTCLRVKDR